jgi:hypothetical protein
MAGIAGQRSGFEADVSAYLKALPSQISLNEGKFALIGDGQFVDVFPTEEEAMREGYRRFGLRGFLVQEITRYDMEMGQHWLSSCAS